MRAEAHHSWLIMAISGQYSEVSLRDNVGRPSSEQLRACSDVLSDALSGTQHQSLQTSFTALFMFR